MILQRKTPFLITGALFAALTAVGAYIRIPLPLVPITLQTMFVLLSGYLLGFFYGTMSQLLYVFAGLIGFPVFAEGGGPGYVLKPTFGYLIAYPFAAGLVGYAIHGKKRFLRIQEAILKLAGFSWQKIIYAGLLGMAVIFLFGVLYLYFVGTHFLSLPMTFRQAIYSGFLVFIPAEILKLMLIYFFIRALTSRAKNQNSSG